MHAVGKEKLDDEAGNHVAEEDDAFWDRGADEIEGSRQDDDVEDIVDETCARKFCFLAWLLNAFQRRGGG